MVENIKTGVVIDASFVLSFLLKENHQVTAQMNKLINERIELISTTFLSFEVGNGLRSAVLRKRLTQRLATKIFQDFFALIISEIKPDFNKTLDLALLENISFYDASYLLLAKVLKIKLLTLDHRLQRLSRQTV